MSDETSNSDLNNSNDKSQRRTSFISIDKCDGVQFKETIIIDFILAVALLIATAGFTASLIKSYISHMAMQNINQHNYKAALNILNGIPQGEFLSVPESDMEDLYNKALYFDAIEKLDDGKDNHLAIKELQKIKSNSKYYNLSQLALKEYLKK